MGTRLTAEEIATIKGHAREEQVEKLQQRAAEGGQSASDAPAHDESGMKEEARVAFIEAGGDPARFDAAWPSLRERLLEDETVKRLEERRNRAFKIRF